MVIFDVQMEHVWGHMVFAMVDVNVGIVQMRKIVVSAVIIKYNNRLLVSLS